MKKIQKYNFTLIEMIAVVAIASMLIGIFVPAFNRMMFGSKVDQATSNFKLGLEMAQSQAVSSRKYVAMILPGSHTNSTDSSKAADKRLKPFVNGGYRLAFVRKSGNTYYFNGWVPGSSWRNAYDGAMLVAAINEDDERDDLPPVNDDLELYFKVSESSADISNSSVKDKNKHFIEIQTDGNASGNTDDITDLGSDNLKGIVFSPYGGVMGDVTPMQFYFTEVKISDGKYTFPNKDNFLALKLNSITGKVEYSGR